MIFIAGSLEFIRKENFYSSDRPDWYKADLSLAHSDGDFIPFGDPGKDYRNELKIFCNLDMLRQDYFKQRRDAEGKQPFPLSPNA